MRRGVGVVESGIVSGEPVGLQADSATRQRHTNKMFLDIFTSAGIYEQMQWLVHINCLAVDHLLETRS